MLLSLLVLLAMQEEFTLGESNLEHIVYSGCKASGGKMRSKEPRG